MDVVSSLLEAHGELTRLGARMCEARASLIRQHQTKQCDLASAAFTEIWRNYTRLAHEQTSKTIQFNQAFSDCINVATENQRTVIESSKAPVRRKSVRKAISLRLTIPTQEKSGPSSHFDEDDVMDVRSATPTTTKQLTSYLPAPKTLATSESPISPTTVPPNTPQSPLPPPRVEQPMRRQTSRSPSLCLKALSPHSDIGCVCGNSMHCTRNPGKVGVCYT